MEEKLKLLHKRRSKRKTMKWRRRSRKDMRIQKEVS
jgi:hypothetical protein